MAQGTPMTIVCHLTGLEAKRKLNRIQCQRPKAGSTSSFLWKTRTQPPSYFFGTIHVPYTRVWDFIPEAAKEAFHLSDAVYFELDLTDPYTVAALTKCQLLPKGKTLSDVLPERIYERLKRHLLKIKTVMSDWLSDTPRAAESRAQQADLLFRQITLDWERKRPVWVLLMLNSLTESDVKTRGIPVLDLYLAQEAERKNKYTGAVESVNEQCAPLNRLNLNQVIFVLNQTLKAKEAHFSDTRPRSSIATEELIKHYQCGNLDSVIFNQDTLISLDHTPEAESREKIVGRRIDQYFRNELILKRNERMGQRVAHLIKSYPQKSFFFAFGAGHFIGNHSILDYVTADGLGIDPVPMKFVSVPKLPVKTRKPIRSRPSLVPSLSTIQDFSNVHSATVDSNDEFFKHYFSRLQKHQEPPNVWLEFLNSGGKRSSSHNDSSLSVPISATREQRHWFHSKRKNFNDLWVKLEPMEEPSKLSSSSNPWDRPRADIITIHQTFQSFSMSNSNSMKKQSLLIMICLYYAL
ncbi:metalloprotease TIKI1-like isoform X2 [Artemia franciscana]|uniref:Metalloprotease TIKI homolog n=1 Tax=Artemia franciscana TaxID=6661 RepID=A0AA88L1X2_ARTSF|nr:hypothetical protein QYM36_013337 [Artemia franciscana]